MAYTLRSLCLFAGLVLVLGDTPTLTAAEPAKNGRAPADDAQLRYWLQNMLWHHHFTVPEMSAALAIPEADVQAALKRWNIREDNAPQLSADHLRVLPYPGGRHPRIGFLEGAIEPQRETKISVFTPWDPASYVVADIPEAIWSNLGLTYLAHTHVPTIWTKAGVELEPQEWQRHEDGTLSMQRRLPNGIEFGTKVRPERSAVHMEMWLRNGTDEKLTGMRVQNCVMLKGARGFTRQTNENKVFAAPYVACQSDQGGQWVITAWVPGDRAWGNEKCPCLHSDPKFPDCEAGGTQQLQGWLSFYEGDDIQGEFRRIDATGWRQAK